MLEMADSVEAMLKHALYEDTIDLARSRLQKYRNHKRNGYHGDCVNFDGSPGRPRCSTDPDWNDIEVFTSSPLLYLKSGNGRAQSKISYNLKFTIFVS